MLLSMLEYTSSMVVLPAGSRTDSGVVDIARPSRDDGKTMRCNECKERTTAEQLFRAHAKTQRNIGQFIERSAT